MKTILVSLCAAAGLVFPAAAADVTAKLSDVHLCCGGCVKGVQSAVDKVPGATMTADRKASTVTLTGPDAATVQKAADAVVAAGYFGTTSDAAIKMSNNSGAKGKKVESVEIEGVHLCCGQCVDAVDAAVKGVSGVKGHTAVKDAKSFLVTGDFNDQEVFTALQKAGLAGRVKK